MIRPTFIDLNLIELNYYPFMTHIQKNMFQAKQKM